MSRRLPTIGARTRRRFLATGVRLCAGAGLAPLLSLEHALGATGGATGEALTPPGSPIPEYAGSLDELLVVYDQVRSFHLLREIVEILRLAPPDARIHVLASAALVDEARARFEEHGLEAVHVVSAAAESLSGDWGRDVFQIARDPDGVRVIHVPWNKAAATREALGRGVTNLEALERADLRVRLLPAAFEGGNLMADRTRGGRRVLFAGSTIAVETIALYARWYGTSLRAHDVARILSDGLGVEEVVWIGPRDDSGRLVRQPRLLFHVDMGLTLVDRGTAVVARLDPADPWPERHRQILVEELARTREALAARESTASPPFPELPGAEEESRWIDARVEEERVALRAAVDHLEDTASRLLARGYDVHRLPTEPERARRFQSYTNVIPSRDRLIVPIYPSIDRVHGWTVPGENGRDHVDVDLGMRDSSFELTGGNLAAVELYRALHPDVRVVRDYFYLASGNAHCVIGRLS